MDRLSMFSRIRTKWKLRIRILLYVKEALSNLQRKPLTRQDFLDIVYSWIDILVLFNIISCLVGSAIWLLSLPRRSFGVDGASLSEGGGGGPSLDDTAVPSLKQSCQMVIFRTVIEKVFFLKHGLVMLRVVLKKLEHNYYFFKILLIKRKLYQKHIFFVNLIFNDVLFILRGFICGIFLTFFQRKD